MFSSIYPSFFNSKPNAEKKDFPFEPEIIPQLPKALCQFILFPYFDLETKTAFALDPQFSIIPAFKKTLWECIAQGEQVLAEKLLKAHPAWLWERDTIVDLSKRTIVDVTPFQLAYGGHDVEMCQMMLPFAKGKESDILNQIYERFPALTEEEKPYDFSRLSRAIKSNDNDQIDEAFKKFKEDFQPKKIEKGWHFNVQNLFLALQLADAYRSVWSVEHCSLVYQKCVGYLQQQLPVSYAKIHCHGIKKFCNANQPLKRSLTLDDNTSFYDSEFEDKCFIISNWEAVENIISAARFEYDNVLNHSHIFRELCDVKKTAMEKLMQQLLDLQPYRCLIC